MKERPILFSMWRSEHDPCPFSLENETLRAENERLEKQVARFLEPVSDEEQAELGIKAFVNGASIRYELFPRKNVESLIAKRLGPKGESDGR